MRPVSMRFDYDLKTFKANLDRIMKDFKEQMVQIFRYTAPKFATALAKFTPPLIGKTALSPVEKLYYRPILNLADLVQGKYPGYKHNQEDLRMIKRGYFFKIINDKKGVRKGWVYGYAKKKAEAKRIARIKNRGLYMQQWGSTLDTVNATKQAAITRLQGKSPNLLRYKFSETKIAQDNDPMKLKLSIRNKVKGIDEVHDLAVKLAQDAALRSMNNRMRMVWQQRSAKI